MSTCICPCCQETIELIDSINVNGTIDCVLCYKNKRIAKVASWSQSAPVMIDDIKTSITCIEQSNILDPIVTVRNITAVIDKLNDLIRLVNA